MSKESENIVNSFLTENPIYKNDNQDNYNAFADLVDYVVNLYGGVSPPPPPTVDPKGGQNA